MEEKNQTDSLFITLSKTCVFEKHPHCVPCNPNLKQQQSIKSPGKAVPHGLPRENQPSGHRLAPREALGYLWRNNSLKLHKKLPTASQTVTFTTRLLHLRRA